MAQISFPFTQTCYQLENLVENISLISFRCFCFAALIDFTQHQTPQCQLRLGMSILLVSVGNFNFNAKLIFFVRALVLKLDGED